MRTADIRSTMEAYLGKLGFRRSSFLWKPGCLVLTVAGELHQIKMPSGMSRRALTFEMGWIACLAKLKNIEPPGRALKAKGRAAGIPAMAPA